MWQGSFVAVVLKDWLDSMKLGLLPRFVWYIPNIARVGLEVHWGIHLTFENFGYVGYLGKLESFGVQGLRVTPGPLRQIKVARIC